MTIIETHELGKRYSKTWALSNCTLSLPAGRVTALVGPNGAGKTTLQHLLVGLATPTTGNLTVLDGLAPGSKEALAAIAFVAQDAPLYRYLSVAEMIRLSGHLNRQFDHPLAVRRCAELCLPGDNKVGKLSGGQQAQLALTLALSRRPRLLILDEPLARLDPLARHEFMALLMVAAAEDGLSILLSSHVVSELERVANHLVVLAAGRVQMAGDIVELLEHHRVLVGPADQLPLIERRFHVLEARRGQRQASLVVAAHPDDEVPAGWQAAEVNLEELVLALLREGRSSDKGRLGVSEEPEKARVTA